MCHALPQAPNTRTRLGLIWKHMEDGRSHNPLLPGFDIRAAFPLSPRSHPGIKTSSEGLVQQYSFNRATCSGPRKYQQETSALETLVLLLIEMYKRKSDARARGNSELRRLWYYQPHPAEPEMGAPGWR